MLKHWVGAKLLLAVVCLFSAANTYAAGEIIYAPSTMTTGCSNTGKYNALSASSANLLKITCPYNTSVDSPPLKYEPSSLTWCGAYDKIVVDKDKTVTISCAPLFSIVPEKYDVTLNKILTFTVTRTVAVANKLDLTLTLSTGSGHFTDVDGKADYGISRDESMDPNQSTKSIYVMPTTLGPAKVTASAPGSAPANVGVTVVTNVNCPSSENSPVEVDIGELPLTPSIVEFRYSIANRYWQIPAGGSVAIKFKINNTPASLYQFKFDETTGDANNTKELAFNTCKGVWSGTMGTNCSIKQTSGNSSFALTTNTNNSKTCHAEPGKVYYLNIRDTATGIGNDLYRAIRFLLSLYVA